MVTGVALSGESENKEQKQSPKSVNVAGNKSPKPKTTPKEQPYKYKIVYTDFDQRYDGGINYYALLDSTDVSNSNFEGRIRDTIKKIVSEKGKKISIEFHDNMSSLDISYKQYGDQSLGRPRTQLESDIEARHFIASYDGQMSTSLYNNTLMFFPGATNYTPKVGKYVATEEFNP
jgi:hypothetical protein